MLKKKSEKSDLENKRGVFLQLGLVITLASILVAFEWSTKAYNVISLYNDSSDEIPETIKEIPRTRPEEKIKPPPPVFPEINIVDNILDFDEAVFDFDANADEGDIFDYFPVEENEEEYEEDPFYWIVPQMPRFKNGDLSKFRDYIQRNIKYPEMATEMNIQGKVYVQFVIDKNGKLTDAVIIKGVDPLLDNEVLKAVNASPAWKPGEQRGIPVRVAMTMPVVFKLQ